FLPLMRHERARRVVVADAVELAQQLPARQQRQAVAALVGLGHRFLTGAELDTLLEGLMSTSIGQQLIDRGQQQAALRILTKQLTKRFGPLPPAIDAQLARIQDAERLEMLLDIALSVHSLEEFAQALE